MRTLFISLALSLTLGVWAQKPQLITQQPEGTLRTYQRSGKAFFAYYGSPTQTVQDYTVVNIVTSPDGKTVYMKDPISQANSGNWIAGTRDEAGRLHFPLGQYVQYFEGSGYGWQTAVLKLMSYDETTGAQYYLDSAMQEVSFTPSADGQSLTMDALGEQQDQGGYPGAMYALIYDDDQSFVGYADYGSVYSPFTYTYTTLPETATPETWTFTYSNAQEGEKESLPVVVADGKVYMAGLSIHDPAACIVGTIEGNKVSFASDQYVGHSSGFLLYAFGASYETKTFYDEEWDETYTTNVMTPQPALECTLDATTGTLKADGQQALILNMGKAADQGVNYMSVALDPAFQLPAGSTLGLTPLTQIPTPEGAGMYDMEGRRVAAGQNRGGLILIQRGRKVMGR